MFLKCVIIYLYDLNNLFIYLYFNNYNVENVQQQLNANFYVLCLWFIM